MAMRDEKGRFVKGHKYVGDGNYPFYKGHHQKKMHLAPNWRGGRRITRAGHVHIYCPTHPNCNASGYIFEHRLVMEKHIGQHLKPTDVVHHINFIPSDNRIENLMLFETKHEHAVLHRKRQLEMTKGIL